MKIELSPKKIVKDCLTIWNEPSPEVDLTMDLKKLSFKPGSVDEIFAFHVLDHLFPEEVVEAVKNWRSCLAVGGKLWLVVDDFEYVARAFTGGDISIDLFNSLYTHPTQFSRDNLVARLKDGGFKEDKVTIWFAEPVDDKFIRRHDELVLEATKQDE